MAQLHSAEYTVVEAADYYDRSAADFRHAMDAADQRCAAELVEQADELETGIALTAPPEPESQPTAPPADKAAD